MEPLEPVAPLEPVEPVERRFEPVIGLEIHAQLLTKTKIFCGCSTQFGDPPNTNVCPVCLGLPGALPVLNREAVNFAILAALALGCRINPRSVFARKNYFYPDLPKGYQISQYDQPLASEGAVLIEGPDGPKRIGIIRVHLEEDAGKSLHDGFTDSVEKTYVDFNRSGTPLIEIVTHPDLRSADEAARFFERLRDTLVWLRVNDGNMEEGSLRCDANVSVRPIGQERFGTKAEVKNVNSFRYLQKALEYEITRQIEVLQSGGRVVQETRLWDQASGRTVSMRSKEEAHDYRYFPEPDLPPVELTPERVAAIQQSLPELADARRTRFIAEYAIPEYDATELTRSRALGDFFEATARASGNAKAASNWIMGELSRKLNELGTGLERAAISPDALAGLIALIDRGTINSTTAKDVFEKMYTSGESAEAIVQREGLAQISDESSILERVHTVMRTHSDAVAQYRSGQQKTFGFLVGQVMKATAGKASPKLVNELLRRELDRG